MGGPPAFPVDVLPVAQYESQGWGCTDYQGEWYDANCPDQHHHTGIDLGRDGGVPLDSPIYATRSGIVTRIGSIYLGDQAVGIRLDQPEAGAQFLIYGHCDKALVSVGQHVNAGDQIALAGTKGSSTAVHLHLRADSTYDYEAPPGTDVDPTPFLKGDELNQDFYAALYRLFITITEGRDPAPPSAASLGLYEDQYWGQHALDVGPVQWSIDLIADAKNRGIAYEETAIVKLQQQVAGLSTVTSPVNVPPHTHSGSVTVK